MRAIFLEELRLVEYQMAGRYPQDDLYDLLSGRKIQIEKNLSAIKYYLNDLEREKHQDMIFIQVIQDYLSKKPFRKEAFMQEFNSRMVGNPPKRWSVTQKAFI